MNTFTRHRCVVVMTSTCGVVWGGVVVGGGGGCFTVSDGKEMQTDGKERRLNALP